MLTKIFKISCLLLIASYSIGCSSKGSRGGNNPTVEPGSIILEPASSDTYWNDGQIPINFNGISETNQLAFMNACNDLLGNQINISCVDYSGSGDFVTIHSDLQAHPSLVQYNPVYSYNYLQLQSGNLGGENILFIQDSGFTPQYMVEAIVSMIYGPNSTEITVDGIVTGTLLNNLLLAYPIVVTVTDPDLDNPGGRFPLCEFLASDPDGDGYGWENEQTCVIAGSDPDINGGILSPFPICLSSETDQDGDGYGWENNETCVVDGVIIDTTNNNPTAYPACVSTSSDPDGDGYGWENEQTCLINETSQDGGDDSSNSNTPTCSSSAVDPDGDGFGWENEQTCIVDNSNDNGGDDSSNSGTPVCASADSDPDGDGFGWENEQTCIVDNSNDNGGDDSSNSGTPVCTSADSDPDGDGFGWENEQTCIVQL